MIDMLDVWMNDSATNFNIVVGCTALVMVCSLMVLFWNLKKIKYTKKHAKELQFKIIKVMFITAILISVIFISLVDRNVRNFRQIYLLMESSVVVVGALYSFKLYKDYSKPVSN